MKETEKRTPLPPPTHTLLLQHPRTERARGKPLTALVCAVPALVMLGPQPPPSLDPESCPLTLVRLLP